jgi:hypothetical protein
MFGPKHTLKSVATDLISGLGEGTIVLERDSFQAEELVEKLASKGLDQQTIQKVLEVLKGEYGKHARGERHPHIST